MLGEMLRAKKEEGTSMSSQKDNKYRLYCSTGTIISKYNGFDYTLMNTVLTPIVRELSLDGCEFMMLTVFYEKFDEIVSYMEKVGMTFPVLHSDKEIGVLLGTGKEEDDREALRRFAANCAFARRLSADRIVIHLWGGLVSDKNSTHNISMIPAICDIAEKHGVTPLIENIPCAAADPISHWEEINALDSRARFIYDTRFGEFHRQNPDIPRHPFFKSGLVEHMHISDFLGEKGDFTRLRPILHPGEGQIDFHRIFSDIEENGYRGSITLESPVVFEDGSLDTDKLRRTLSFIKENV